MRLNVERAEDYDDLSARAARRLCEFIRAAPRGVMALPTGSTPVGTYRRTVESLRTRFLDCSGLFLVDVDEIAGLPPAHPESCAGTLRRQLLRFDPISSASCRLLDGVAADLVAEARRHERAVRDHGGLGLAVLGIGVNGHIALNEPGTPFASRAHVAELTESTVERLALSEVPDGTGPRLGLTLGIGTLLRARRILLLASGEEKASILNAALNGEVTERIPASALQMHPELHVIADEAALALWNDGERKPSGREPRSGTPWKL